VDLILYIVPYNISRPRGGMLHGSSSPATICIAHASRLIELAAPVPEFKRGETSLV
jgi:hypothetical protein